MDTYKEHLTDENAHHYKGSRAGQLARPQDLINVDELIGNYYDLVPDCDDPKQRVIFGTSGHRGSSNSRSFNEAHIVSICHAIARYRQQANITGPLYLGRDTHALSFPAWKTVIETLVAHDVQIYIDSRDDYTPTPVISHAILTHNAIQSEDPHQNYHWEGPDCADGIVITPSHNPPRFGGIKYDPPTGGPAPSSVTSKIATIANEVLPQWKTIRRIPFERAINSPLVKRFDYREHYVSDLDSVIDFDIIRNSDVRFGVDPLGGASVHYWPLIAEKYRIDLSMLNDKVDPQWSFMSLDHDENIRMDPSSPYAMQGLVDRLNNGAWEHYDVIGGTDPDADRHGIICPQSGVLNPNRYLSVCAEYLFSGNRPQWRSTKEHGLFNAAQYPQFGLCSTIVTSALLKHVADSLHIPFYETPVGFKWAVDPLIEGRVAFCGEESSGITFLRKDAAIWTTDKDGIIPDLLAAEITAARGMDPAQVYEEQAARLGNNWYERIDTPLTDEERSQFAQLTTDSINATVLGGEPIEDIQTRAPGNNEAFGGIKVVTKNNWFAARPSGTENIYKLYAESFISQEALDSVVKDAQIILEHALS